MSSFFSTLKNKTGIVSIAIMASLFVPSIVSAGNIEVLKYKRTNDTSVATNEILLLSVQSNNNIYYVLMAPELILEDKKDNEKKPHTVLKKQTDIETKIPLGISRKEFNKKFKACGRALSRRRQAKRL